MNCWLEITPLDTLFFRGSEPMQAGQLAAVSLFPPPNSVVCGALRTAVLMQNSVNFNDYKHNRCTDHIHAHIGKCGEDPPFIISAFLMKKAENFYAPAPASWFVDTEKELSDSSDYIGLRIKPGKPLNPESLGLDIKASATPLSLVPVDYEAISLTGCWIKYDILQREPGEIAPDDILTSGELYSTENRTGISMLEEKTNQPTRKAQTGKLYSAVHVRLREGVTIVIGISNDIGLAQSGHFIFGGEKRMIAYKKIDAPFQPSAQEAELYCSLAAVELNDDNKESLFCSGKPRMYAGWDLAAGFHKPTVTTVPAGAVFTRNINNQLIPLVQ